MSSHLKWRFGFGWSPVFVLLGAAAAAVWSTGVVRWGAAAVVAAIGVFLLSQYWRWNGRGWRQVHFRAMLAYTGIAGREAAAARQAGRSFDPRRACTELGLLLCGDDKRETVETMLRELVQYEGVFLAGLVELHVAEALPGFPFETRRDAIATLRSRRLGPELVIASVIENIYGGPEAARYAIALAAGETNP